MKDLSYIGSKYQENIQKLTKDFEISGKSLKVVLSSFSSSGDYFTGKSIDHRGYSLVVETPDSRGIRGIERYSISQASLDYLEMGFVPRRDNSNLARVL